MPAAHLGAARRSRRLHHRAAVPTARADCGRAPASAATARGEPGARTLRTIDGFCDFDAFVSAFGEWVEACWFAEHDRAGARLEALLAFPPDVLLVGSLTLLTRLLERSDPRGFAPVLGDGEEMGQALADHLLITGPDPGREALIRAVVAGAGPGTGPAARRELLATWGPDAVTATALECSSVLAQALANRWGVVPSNVLEDF